MQLGFLCCCCVPFLFWFPPAFCPFEGGKVVCYIKSSYISAFFNKSSAGVRRAIMKLETNNSTSRLSFSLQNCTQGLRCSQPLTRNPVGARRAVRAIILHSQLTQRPIRKRYFVKRLKRLRFIFKKSPRVSNFQH